MNFHNQATWAPVSIPPLSSFSKVHRSQSHFFLNSFIIRKKRYSNYQLFQSCEVGGNLLLNNFLNSFFLFRCLMKICLFSFGCWTLREYWAFSGIFLFFSILCEDKVIPCLLVNICQFTALLSELHTVILISAAFLADQLLRSKDKKSCFGSPCSARVKAVGC